MANHKSAILRIKKSDTARVRNKYYHKTTRNAIRDLRNEKDKKKAEASLSSIYSMLDKLVKRNIISKNKSANLKSKLTKSVQLLEGEGLKDSDKTKKVKSGTVKKVSKSSKTVKSKTEKKVSSTSKKKETKVSKKPSK